MRDGCTVEAVVAASPAEVLGVNDKVQLAEAEAALRASRAAELMRAGVTVVDPCGSTCVVRSPAAATSSSTST